MTGGLMFVKNCRMCASERLALFLDLGEMPPADQFLHKHQLSEHRDAYPLQVAVCEECGLIQLNYVVPLEILYCDDYPYESSTTTLPRIPHTSRSLPRQTPAHKLRFTLMTAARLHLNNEFRK